MIPYGCQNIGDDDIAAVVEVLRSDWLTQGPAIPQFERAVAEYCGAREAVAVSSGTGALHLAAIACGLAPGGMLWTSPITFVASANCARYCGADVDFVDVEPDTGNMSAEALEHKLERAQSAGRLPDVVVPVHLGGLPCDMDRIGDLSRHYGFKVIEDASHALGAWHEGRPVGSGANSLITVFSFHPVKLITTGEGGVVATQDEAVAQRVRSLRSHGITRDPAQMTDSTQGRWYYEQLELGYNYRLTDIHAALGTSQMRKLDAFIERREEISRAYDDAFAELPLARPGRRAGSASAWHLYIVRLTPDAGVDRRAFYDALVAAGLGVNVHYIPVHLQPYYRSLGFGPGMFPEAERFYEAAVTLPIHPRMTARDVATVVASVKSALA